MVERSLPDEPSHFSLSVCASVCMCMCVRGAVIGTALGLNLLFGIPMLVGVFITTLDVLLLLCAQVRTFCEAEVGGFCALDNVLFLDVFRGWHLSCAVRLCVRIGRERGTAVGSHRSCNGLCMRCGLCVLLRVCV